MDKDAVKELTKEQIEQAKSALDYASLIITTMAVGAMHENLSMKEWLIRHAAAEHALDTALQSLNSAGSNWESGANEQCPDCGNVYHTAKGHNCAAPPSVTSDRKDEQTEEMAGLKTKLERALASLRSYDAKLAEHIAGEQK